MRPPILLALLALLLGLSCSSDEKACAAALASHDNLVQALTAVYGEDYYTAENFDEISASAAMYASSSSTSCHKLAAIGENIRARRAGPKKPKAVEQTETEFDRLQLEPVVTFKEWDQAIAATREAAKAPQAGRLTKRDAKLIDACCLRINGAVSPDRCETDRPYSYYACLRTNGTRVRPVGEECCRGCGGRARDNLCERPDDKCLKKCAKEL